MQENSIIKSNILKYLEYKDITPYKFYQETGITRGILGQNNGLSEKNTLKFLDYYHDINAEWLLTGKGNMIKNELGVQKVESLSNEPGINYEKKGVPYFDVDFIGGFDLVVQDQTVNPSFYIDFEPFNDADYWVNVTGKSMSPFISHGDIIALQVYNNWERFLLGGEIYAIITEDFRTVKILQDGKDQEHFALIPYSKDPNFKTQQLPKELVKQVFKVKGAIKKFF